MKNTYCTTTIRKHDGETIIHSGQAAVTITLAYEDPKDAEILIEYSLNRYEELSTIITDLMKFAHENIPNKGIVENAIARFAEEEGMMIGDKLAHFQFKDKRN